MTQPQNEKSREEEELIIPDQLVADTSRPLPRANLASRAIAALWALRVFVTIVSLMVIYTFAQHLYQPMRGVCTDSFTSITLPDENAHQQTS